MLFRLKMIIVAAPWPPPRSATLRPRCSHQRAAAALAAFTAVRQTACPPVLARASAPEPILRRSGRPSPEGNGVLADGIDASAGATKVLSKMNTLAPVGREALSLPGHVAAKRKGARALSIAAPGANTSVMPGSW